MESLKAATKTAALGGAAARAALSRAREGTRSLLVAG